LITREQAERLRDQLLQVLAEDAHNTDRLVARLDGIGRETGIGAHAALLLILTHLAFEEHEARGHWESILAHRHELSLAVGRDVGLRVAVVDYFVNVNRRMRQPTLIDLELSGIVDEQAGRDGLTGLHDGRSFRRAVQAELRRAKRYRQQVAVVLFDLDDFLATNQRLGKLVCDRLLREAAMLLGNKIRDIDVAARPGEDELALVLPETDRAGGLLVAERFRRELQAHFARREAGGAPVNLTVSAGVATYPHDAADAETLLARAAQALYQSKGRGKNGIQAWLPERRRFVRFDLAPGRFEIEVLTPSPRSGVSARNLSRNGLLFTSPEPLEVGEEIEVRLAGSVSGEASPLRVRGRVVRLEELPLAGDVEAGSDRFEVGMAFEPSEGADDADDVLRFLERAAAAARPHAS